MRRLLVIPFLCVVLHAQITQQIVAIQNATVAASGSCGTIARYSASDSTGTSGNVSSVTLGAGDQVVVMMSESNGSSFQHITSVTGQTGYLLPFWASSYAGSGFAGGSMSAFYIPSASAISNATLTVNFNASATLPRVWVVDVPNASGTASIDAVGTFNQGHNTASSLTEVPLTASGTKDCVIEFAGFTSSVGSPWNTNFAALGGSSQGSSGTSYQANLTSSPSTPVWANANGNGMGGVFGIALGYGTTTSVPWSLQDFSGGVVSTQPTLAQLDAGLFGAANDNSVNPGGLAGAYQSGGIGSQLSIVSTPLFSPINSPVRFNIGGVTYPNTGQQTLQYAQGTTAQGITYNYPGYNNTGFLVDPVSTQCVDLELTNAATDTVDGNMDIFTLGSEAGGFATMRFNNTGTTNSFNPEGGSGSTSNLFAGTASTHYKLCGMQNAGNLASQQPGGSLIGGNPATVTLSPGPWTGTYTSVPSTQLSTLGLSGVVPYYISGGTGTAEYVAPTSTTCGMQSSSCTVTFTPVNSHSGAWTIAAASVIWILNATATSVLNTNYFGTDNSYPYYACIANCGSAGTGTSGRNSYFGNWAMCYNGYYKTGAACPAIIVP